MNQECGICGRMVWRKHYAHARGSELYRCGTCIRLRRKLDEER